MDKHLLEKLGLDVSLVQLLPSPAGAVRLRDGSEYSLKPLRELYGTGESTTSLDTSNERHLKLLMAFESAVLDHDHSERGLTDGGVQFAMEKLGLNPEAEVRGDALVAAIQLQLRVFLSLNDYNRQEVRLAARKLVKSIQRHSRTGGTRAYLEFIHDHVPHGH